ncbi:MAG: hypothetical protein ACRD2O_06985, partial [Terriglobia bacterium]
MVRGSDLAITYPVPFSIAVSRERRPQGWRWPSLSEYSGVSAAEQKRRCGLTIDRCACLRTREREYDQRRSFGAAKKQAADLKDGGPRYQLTHKLAELRSAPAGGLR